MPRPSRTIYVLVGIGVALGTAVAATLAMYLAHLVLEERLAEDHVAWELVGMLLLCSIVAGITAALAFRQRQEVNRVIEAAEQLADGRIDAWEPSGDSSAAGKLDRAFARLHARMRETSVSRNYLDRVLSSMRDAVILVDNNGYIRRVNSATTRLVEYGAEELIGKEVIDLIAPPARPAFVRAGHQSGQAETTFRARSGHEVPVSYSWSEIETGSESIEGCILAARDITERKLADRRIRYLARIDALTKVPNRMQFQHLLQRAIAKASKRSEQIGLLYLDVDRFKDINDTFGHVAGDTSLETLATRVNRLLPERAFIGRLAGDEFGIVVFGEPDRQPSGQWLEDIAQQLQREIAEVLIVQGQELHMTVSIGIASFPTDADNVLDLIRNADAALYHAKRKGGNHVRSYRPEMNAEAVERLILKSKLRRSYELDELLMNYQPKIDLRTGRIAGAEALVRWELSEHGLVLPAEFIPLAEETNLIIEIGEWVLKKVCEDYANWTRRGIDPGPISVNLSLKQLAQPNFSRRIARILQKHGLKPGNLELEITETTLMEDPERTVRILGELHQMGLQLAIDDFGTGYSSLSALQKFPIGTLKIDKSFVRDADTDTDDATIVATIVDMAHGMNMRVVAEGVESEDQLSFLRVINCDYVQGLLFGQPMAADDYEILIREQSQGTDSYRALFA